jgi:nicotinamide phosphoribosyltransferase
VRVIQGDGITVDTIRTILRNLEAAGFSADNLAFGQGGGLLQQLNRDTLKFAMKASAICVNGVWRDVFKQPVDQPDKASKSGRLALVYQCGVGSCGWHTVRKEKADGEDQLVTVFENGKLLVKYTFDEIRARAADAFKE